MAEGEDNPQAIPSKNNHLVTPKQKTSLLDGLAIIVGVIIGSGVILNPIFLVVSALLLWTFWGLFSMVGLLCYGELGTMSSCDYDNLGSILALLLLWVTVVIIRPCGQAVLAFISFMVLFFLFTTVASGESVPLQTEGNRLYVETEEENAHCLIHPNVFDVQPDRSSVSRAPCPKGYYATGSESGPLCGLCPFDAELRTYMPYGSHCGSCIICKGCPNGFEVEELCTRVSSTRCRAMEPDLPSVQPSMMVPMMVVSGPPDDPGPSAAEDDVLRTSDPPGPEIDNESIFDWVSKITVLMIVVLFIMALLIFTVVLLIFIVVRLVLYIKGLRRENPIKKEKAELEKVTVEDKPTLGSRTHLSTALENDYSDGLAMTDLTDGHHGSMRHTSPVLSNGSSIGSNVPDGTGRPIGSSVGNAAVGPIGSTVPNGASGFIGSSVRNGAGRPTGSTEADEPNDINTLIGSSGPIDVGSPNGSTVPNNPSELGGSNRPHSAVSSNGSSGPDGHDDADGPSGPAVERHEVGNQDELEKLVPSSVELP